MMKPIWAEIRSLFLAELREKERHRPASPARSNPSSRRCSKRPPASSGNERETERSPSTLATALA